MACAASNVNDHMIDKTLNQSRFRCVTVALWITSTTVQIILAPEVYSALLSETECVISTAFNLRHLQLLSEQGGAHNELRSRIYP